MKKNREFFEGFFKEEIAHINIKVKEKGKRVFFSFAEGRSGLDIVDHTTSCNCTGNVYIKDDGMYFVYNDNTHLKEGVESAQVQKTIKVYFDDGEDLWKKNGRGVEIENEFKAHALLKLIVNVSA